MKKLIIKNIIIASGIAMITGCGQVDSGEVGFFTEWGQVVGKELNEGLHFYPAPGKNLEVYDIRNQIVKVKTAVFTRDVQSMDVEMAVTYCLDRTKVIQLHTSTGRQYKDVLIIPAILSATKDALGTMEAGDIVATREKAVELITKTIQKTLHPFGINISLVSLTNIDYSDAFERAVEEKQVALQKSIKERTKPHGCEKSQNSKSLRLKLILVPRC
jgi:regulator of protease activity HflC (stomatin/prohibitin superfamily)